MQSDSSKDVLERDKWWRRGGARREQFDEPGNGNGDDDDDVGWRQRQRLRWLLECHDDVNFINSSALEDLPEGCRVMPENEAKTILPVCVAFLRAVFAVYACVCKCVCLPLPR